MKQTKRFLSLFLALVLCLGMTACGSADDKAFEEADALLAAGDYDGAIAAFSAIGRYQEISAKIAEAEKLRNDANAGFLFGKWKNLGVDASLTLNQDGSGVLADGAGVYSITYSYENNVVSLTQPLVITLVVETHNGVTHLICDGYNMDFIPEADYATAGPAHIELTMDNWQEYFELREVNDIGLNPFGEVSHVTPTAGIFLKEEYYSRLLKNYSAVEISFELTYNNAEYQVLNVQPGEFKHELAGQYERKLISESPEMYSAIVNIEDHRQYSSFVEQSPYYNTLSGRHFAHLGSSSDGYGNYTIGCHTNFQVSRVIGTLKLFPE